MMINLSKLGIAITVIISLTLSALFLEVLYLLLRRRHLFLCWKRKSRVGPHRTSPPASAPSPSPPELAEQVMKWQCLHGPSRVLFTIKEEEREGFDSDLFSSADIKRVCHSHSDEYDHDHSLVDEVVAVVIDTSPFSTPCASPPYFTPSSSPLRDVQPNAEACITQDSLPKALQVDHVLS